MRELFVYWKLPRAQLAEAEAAARRMQAGLCAGHAGLQARLYRRDDTAASATLMEIYARPPAGIDAALQLSIDRAAAAMAPWRSGPRHVEAFESADG